MEPTKPAPAPLNMSLLPQLIIAVIFISGFILLARSVFVGEIELSPEQREIAIYVLGIFSAGILQIMNFFFGSSAGSKMKTQKMIGR